MVLAKGSQLLGECQQCLAVHGILPVQPADLIVLAVRIVVASLGVATLISRKKERRPLRQKIDRHEIAHLTVSERTDVLFVAGSFHAAVPARVVGISVLIVLPVCLVMLAVVGNQIRQGKAFIAGDIIDHAVLHRIAAHSPQRLMQRILVSL